MPTKAVYFKSDPEHRGRGSGWYYRRQTPWGYWSKQSFSLDSKRGALRLKGNYMQKGYYHTGDTKKTDKKRSKYRGKLRYY